MVATGATRPENERLSRVRHRRFSVSEYHGMIDAGILGEDEHVELLEGEIVEMSPQDKPHARAMTRLTRWFARALGDEYLVRPQLPLTFPDSEPEPDLAIVRAEDEAAAGRHPGTALLVIEIADSSARYDLEVKARIYARAGIPEYWLVLVKDRAIAVLRGPDVVAGEYRERLTLTGAATVAPAGFSGPEVVVQSLFD